MQHAMRSVRKGYGRKVCAKYNLSQDVLASINESINNALYRVYRVGTALHKRQVVIEKGDLMQQHQQMFKWNKTAYRK